MPSVLSFLKPTGILEGHLAVEPLDLADAEPLQLREAFLVDLAVRCRDMEHHRKYLPYSVPAFIINFGFWASFLLVCARSRIVAYILMPLVVITQASVIFAGMTYGVECREMAIAVINTTSTEALLYIDLQSVLLFVLGLVVVYTVAVLARKLLAFSMSRRARVKQLGLGLMGCAVFLTLPQLIKHYWHWGATESVGFVDTLEPFRRTWPVPQTREQVLHEAVYNHDHFVFDKAYQPINVVVDYYKAIFDFYNPPDLAVAEDMPSEQVWPELPQTVVLYIGESMRADHFPLNGYHRNTMPGMVQEKNLINLYRDGKDGAICRKRLFRQRKRSFRSTFLRFRRNDRHRF